RRWKRQLHLKKRMRTARIRPGPGRARTSTASVCVNLKSHRLTTRSSRAAIALLACWLLWPLAASAQELADLLAVYDAAFGATSSAFTQPLKLSQVDDSGEQLSFYWQQDKYREEYRWLGFTEVFAY